MVAVQVRRRCGEDGAETRVFARYVKRIRWEGNKRMRGYRTTRGFTLLELLTVIAIIAVLAAILFPLAGTVREQARSSSCLSKLHQIWVAASVYRQDEGEYPPVLFGYAMAEIPDPGDPTRKIQVPYNPGAHQASQIVPMSRAEGTLFSEIVRDSQQFVCPNNAVTNERAVTIAYYPANPPAYWLDAGGQPYNWIGTALAAAGCPTDANGVVDCWTSGPLAGQPKYFYTRDSYDIGPRVDANGAVVLAAGGATIYDRHYAVDWTGVKGINDLVVQLKYQQPPPEKTLIAYCTWHVVRNVPTVNAINLAGTAKKIAVRDAVNGGANMFNR